MSDLEDLQQRMDAEKAAYDQEKAKTPKERTAEAMLKAGFTMLGAQNKAEKKAKGGSIKGWGQARGARKAKIY